MRGKFFYILFEWAVNLVLITPPSSLLYLVIQYLVIDFVCVKIYVSHSLEKKNNVTMSFDNKMILKARYYAIVQEKPLHKLLRKESVWYIL
jgi:hypothetical protein